MTYKDIQLKPKEYCTQCIFTGGEWSITKKVAKCVYKAGFTDDKDVPITHPIKMSKKLTYKKLFEGLALCAAKGEPVTKGTYKLEKFNAFQKYKTVNNC